MIQEKENCNLQVADELIRFLFLDAQNPWKPHTLVWEGFWSFKIFERGEAKTLNHLFSLIKHGMGIK
jgi:hypothetical protein